MLKDLIQKAQMQNLDDNNIKKELLEYVIDKKGINKK